jgi:hypothetical protein
VRSRLSPQNARARRDLRDEAWTALFGHDTAFFASSSGASGDALGRDHADERGAAKSGRVSVNAIDRRLRLFKPKPHVRAFGALRPGPATLPKRWSLASGDSSVSCLNPAYGDRRAAIVANPGQCSASGRRGDLKRSWPNFVGVVGRGDWIRTSDPLRPRRRNPHNWGQRETAAPRFP